MSTGSFISIAPGNHLFHNICFSDPAHSRPPNKAYNHQICRKGFLTKQQAVSLGRVNAILPRLTPSPALPRSRAAQTWLHVTITSSIQHRAQQAHNMLAAVSTQSLCTGPDEVPITLMTSRLMTHARFLTSGGSSGQLQSFFRLISLKGPEKETHQHRRECSQNHITSFCSKNIIYRQVWKG